MPPAPQPRPAKPPRTRARTFRRLLLGFLIVTLGWFIVLSALERSLLYPAQYRAALEPVALPGHARSLAVTHDQGKTYANLYLGDGVSPQNRGPIVLYAHGNGEFIEDYPQGLPGYRALGVSVLLIEYRGCGHSDGSPTKERIDADHAAFYDLATTLPEVDPDRIVFHGRSMGGGIVASLTEQRTPAALVLESAFTSVSDFAATMLVPGFMVKDNFDVTAALRRYAGPVMIIHSDIDGTIPFAMAQKNLAVRPDADFHNYGLHHNDSMPPQFYADLAVFLQNAGVLRNEGESTAASTEPKPGAGSK